MIYRNIFATAIALALFAACKDTPSGNDGLDLKGFEVRITVKDSTGSPVPGLHVSAWNLIPLTGSYRLRAGNRLLKAVATSSVHFDVPATGRVSLTLLALDNTIVEKMIDRGILRAGAYNYNVQISQRSGTYVYKCCMAAQDTSGGAQVFADSIYMVLWQPDPVMSLLGTTSTSGEVTTTDSLRFPNVLSLPGLVETGFDPKPLQIFTISDSVVIVATDSVAGKSQEFRQVVRKGLNDLQLVWNPSQNSETVQTTGPVRTPGAVPRDSVSVPSAWKLYQNYPNPFN